MAPRVTPSLSIRQLAEKGDFFMGKIEIKNKKKIIGVLGGMGPEASTRFYKLLIYHAQKDYGVEKNEEFPEIFLDSIPVPDFIATEEKEKVALSMLIERVKMMDKLPISFFCMACNTGHLLIDKLRQFTDKPFISLLEEVPKYIKRQKVKKVGLLATPTTIRTKMYQKPLQVEGIKVILPENRDVVLLGNIILETIAGKNIERNTIQVQKIARRLLERKAEGIIEACTEIPLIFPQQHLVTVFDTLEILTSAVLSKYYLLK